MDVDSSPSPGDQDVEQPTRNIQNPSDEPGTHREGRWSSEFPSDKNAGAVFQKGLTTFERIRDEEILKPGEVLGPFESEEEWELAKWLIKNVGANQMEVFLKLPIVRERISAQYRTKSDLLGLVDSLPGGVKWDCEEITIQGDCVDNNGKPLTETLELWHRDPVEIMKELVGNPLFKDVMAYEPQRLFVDAEGENRVINEMWTADWWWNLQSRLPDGATIAPIILSSDKTQLSHFRGDKSAWPLYLTLGNISKSIRRQPSSHSTVLIGYIPVGKYDCYTDKAKQFARYRVFHYCVRLVLESLAKAGREGIKMVCSDGYERWMWPILAAYVADYPEQCLVACCMENRCPICKVGRDDRGTHCETPLRDKQETLDLLRRQDNNTHTPASSKLYQELGIRHIVPPFWADLPHCNIFEAFTPDLLHQLHKGVFKDHLVKWCTAIVGEKEIDARFRAMSDYPGLRHFKNGISSVSQWTGREHKEMERVFVGLLAGAVDNRVMKAVKSVVDFIYFASLHSHTSSTLCGLQHALDEFHAHKTVFIELEARYPEHFNIPKIHSMEHYRMLIELFGSADGFNSESPERLHIDYAKDAYRASNKKDYLIQMTVWLQRQENVDRWAVFLEWMKHGSLAPDQVIDTTCIQPEEDLPLDETEDIEHLQAQVTMTKHNYKVAVKHAPALQSVAACQIVTDQRAPQFIPALAKFLRTHGGSIVPQPFDTFGLYKWIKFCLPNIPEASRHKLNNMVRAIPPIPSMGQRQAQPAVIDPALVRTGEQNKYTDSTILQGLRVAQVRVIFRLPQIYGVQSVHPLAYVEWFTPFSSPDSTSGLYSISRSTRMHQPYAEIIEVTRLVRGCHLIPKFGRHIINTWTSVNVGDICDSFFVNPYIDIHTFCALNNRMLFLTQMNL
ncbi:hypothetical protein BJ138DRAFT_1014064 [Hygrophoropsis aurantiaca]|uniref:Uncharacterized protein n=1 Tax=Hygrophoropsis aurantiaca TaxID=72124 RepID=A0ACB8A337_9AGAM|nr:hypothetical protein BJ138DRAFT_1014064 [Hygrophoropsis aurantiaca]